jgi:hypothetical protein
MDVLRKPRPIYAELPSDECAGSSVLSTLPFA